MRTPYIVRNTLAAACLCGLASTANADIYSYAVSRYISYTQTSNAAPTEPDAWLFTAGVVSDTNNEIISASLSFANPGPQSFNLYEATANYHQYYSAFYFDSASILADYPVTTYTLTVDRGFGPETGDVFLPEDDYCPEIPAFTGDTFDRLQNYDATLDFAASINGFTLHPNTTNGRTAITIVPDAGPTAVFIQVLEPGETSFVVPADTLQPDTAYSIGIEYLNFTFIDGAGFGGAGDSNAEFYRGTISYFTTRGACQTTITLQPVAKSLEAGHTAAFVVRAAPEADCSLTYAWSKDGVPLTDGPTGAGSSIIGSDAHTLVIDNVQAGDAGDYTCTVTSDCATIQSDTAALTVNQFCPADFNRSGAVSAQDIFDFLAAFFTRCP